MDDNDDDYGDKDVEGAMRAKMGDGDKGGKPGILCCR